MPSSTPAPAIGKVMIEDIVESLEQGVRDFRAAPEFGLFFGLGYAAAGWLILTILWYLEMPYLAYPLAMGFAIIAPFAATGLYEVSRSLERGEAPTWSGVLGAVGGARHRDLRWMALVTGFILVLWLDIAAILTFGFLGFKSLGPEIFKELFTTPEGLVFLIIGNTVGAIIALAVFSISVLSFPMLFDRDIDFVTAMSTSVRTVIENPRPMLAWAAVIALLVIVALMTVFVGLIFVLPVLGHATWHLYRRAVPADSSTSALPQPSAAKV
jgi:uncharacterized membrane protein